ncbi:hypothetical protein B566_EDAN002238 [Ephemera danica]|nr:hypothetical protein B566_EDAN002238 [Ephemera danica]
MAMIKAVFPPFTAEEVAELPEEGHEWKFGEQATTFAWGGFSDDVLTTLLMDRLTILTEDKCSGLEDWLPTEQICTQSLRFGSGLCDGDYGAPLIVNGSVVAGINMYNSCGGPASPPDRFFNIVPMIPWILNHIKPSA